MATLGTRRVGAIALAMGLLLGAGCGDDDDGSNGADNGADRGDDGGDRREGQLFDVDGDPIAADDLVACLEDAGLEPEDQALIPLGVEDGFERYRVQLGDEDLSATLYVFETPAEADDARPAIALTNEDNERSRVVGNVVLDYSIIPSFDPEGSEAVEGCLDT